MPHSTLAAGEWCPNAPQNLISDREAAPGDPGGRGRRSPARAALADLPGGDRVLAFDAYGGRVLALPDAIAVASPARREELCRIVVQRVVVRDRQLETITWTPLARPLFARKRGGPQGALGTRP